MDLDFWQKTHKVKTSTETYSSSDDINSTEWRPKIEPWLSAIFQSEHFSVLIGSGMTTGLTHMAGINAQGMGRLQLNGTYKEKIKAWADKSASAMNRGEANLEDDIRVALELMRGYEILEDDNAASLRGEINEKLGAFIK
ncbi:MAG: fibronectin-binding protein (FBP), partial [Sphingobacteriales bacterium]